MACGRCEDGCDKDGLFNGFTLGCIVVFILLGFTQFIIGLVYWNDCPANATIPRFMTGAGGSKTIIDVIIGCVKNLAIVCEGAITRDVGAIIALVIEHFIGIVIGSIYVFSDYSYLAGGCDGAKECCDENFIKFALGVSIIEWLLLILPILLLFLIALLR
ncbi:uncharacterized protein LOC132746636 [Ruditapes philippinarum]|uniref:uncharacterized protein LOC132746636 n=1 Tax=Ruditapes philippinarum TaxID=129788 RepID=UPI00295BBFDC|nr:uncharacterized protein LOC132746636 [Ruditapes philippinarum]